MTATTGRSDPTLIDGLEEIEASGDPSGALRCDAPARGRIVVLVVVTVLASLIFGTGSPASTTSSISSRRARSLDSSRSA